MNGNGDHGILNGGEWYRVAIYYQEGPLWATRPLEPQKITFICIGHSMTGSGQRGRWMLDCASPDQPLPPQAHSRTISHRATILDALRQVLTQATGKTVSGVEYGRIEKPENGPGNFWRSVPDVSVVGNAYNTLMESGAASSVTDQLPNKTQEGGIGDELVV